MSDPNVAASDDAHIYRDIAWNGIWKQNPGLVQLLGLCPILAISTNTVNAVSLGLATVLVMALANPAWRRCAISSPTRSASRSSSSSSPRW